MYTARIRQNMDFLNLDKDVQMWKLASQDKKTRLLNWYIQPALTDHLEAKSTHNARLNEAISRRNLMSMKTTMTLTQLIVHAAFLEATDKTLRYLDYIYHATEDPYITVFRQR